MSPKPITLPHTWRPFGARMMGGALGAMLVAMVTTVWFALGSEIRSKFTGFQEGTLVVLGLIALGVWFALMRCKVRADEHGVVVVNGYRQREYAWSQLIGVNLRRGAPWAEIDLSDGTSISAIAIQGSDGDRARRAVVDLRRLIAENTRIERPETE
ncbi:MAG: PH domain-containing protein [Marmoricola sp.]